jgi:hypothetical protein
MHKATPPLPQAGTGLQMRRLQEGYDTNDAVAIHPQRTRFSPLDPRAAMVTLNSALSRKTKPEDAATLATDGGGFRLKHHSCRTLPTKSAPHCNHDTSTGKSPKLLKEEERSTTILN